MILTLMKIKKNTTCWAGSAVPVYIINKRSIRILLLDGQIKNQNLEPLNCVYSEVHHCFGFEILHRITYKMRSCRKG